MITDETTLYCPRYSPTYWLSACGSTSSSQWQQFLGFNYRYLSVHPPGG